VLEKPAFKIAAQEFAAILADESARLPDAAGEAEALLDA